MVGFNGHIRVDERGAAQPIPNQHVLIGLVVISEVEQPVLIPDLRPCLVHCDVDLLSRLEAVLGELARQYLEKGLAIDRNPPFSIRSQAFI